VDPTGRLLLESALVRFRDPENQAGRFPNSKRELPEDNWSAWYDRNLWQNRQNRQRKSKLRRLTLILSLAVLLQVVGAATRAQSPEPSASGNQMLASAIEALDWQVSIAARVRHQSRLDKHTLMGSGKYWQRGTGEKRKSRWEMRTQIAGETASFVQLFDGEHLWTDRVLPSGRKVHRLDVKLLQSRLNAEGLPREVGRTDLIDALRGRGGLTQMLADLMQQYEFDPPRQAQLNGLAVYALIGHWRREQLAALGVDIDLPTGEEASPWPKQLPHHVLVLLGREKLFPKVVEYRRWSDAYLLDTVAGLRPTRDPLVRYEVFEVQFAQAIDPSIFEYKPSPKLQWTDETSLVVERLRAQRGIAAEKLATGVKKGAMR